MLFWASLMSYAIAPLSWSMVATCPTSNDIAVQGNGACIVESEKTGTRIQLNFISGFDDVTLIENDTSAPAATDAAFADFGLTVNNAVRVAGEAAAAAKASGNQGATVGAQRKLSFIKAAEIIADEIISSQVIIVDAAFSNLACADGSSR